MVRWLIVLVYLLLTSVSIATELQVSVDRKSLFLDETLVMRVVLHDGSAPVDFAPLLTDFDVLQQSSAKQVSLINGARSDSRSWEFVLAPKRIGTLSVPSIEMDGQRSDAVALRVTERVASVAGQEQRPYFLRVAVSDVQPYVQQQVIYTMKLYQQQSIADGNVTEPEHADVQLERLGLDKSYVEQVDGHEYSVLERKYALFPQRSGLIELPAITLRARIVLGTRSSRFFAQDTQTIVVRGQSLSLDVLPVPQKYGARWWLASSDVAATAVWEPEQAKLGEPLTLAVTVTASGVLPAQIPVLPDPNVAGVRLYPDGSRAAKKAGSEGIVSQRVSRWTIVPTQPGEIAVAPFELTWWNLRNAQEEVLLLAVPTLQVAGLTVPQATPSPVEAVAVTEAVGPASAEVEQSIAAQDGLRLWLTDPRTVVVLISIVAFATLVIRRRRRRPLPLQTDEQLYSPDAAMVRLVEAVTRADIKVARESMLNWGSGTFRRELRSLPELADLLTDKEFSLLVEELDIKCYRDKGRWYGEPLLEKVKAYKAPHAAAASKEMLPVLS